MSHFGHDQIVEKFIGSRAIDFEALGRFVAENGSLIAASGRGDYGVRFGHYNILACFNINPLDVKLGAIGVNASAIAADVAGSR